jgi:uncharacterized protein YaaQ
MTPQLTSKNNSVLLAVIQSQDMEIAEKALHKMNISINHLPSTGAFLGRRNATLIIGIPHDRSDDVLTAFKENCRQRIEYIAVPLESAPLPLPAPTPITVGGATVFSLPVEYYEEF